MLWKTIKSRIYISEFCSIPALKNYSKYSPQYSRSMYVGVVILLLILNYNQYISMPSGQWTLVCSLSLNFRCMNLWLWVVRLCISDSNYYFSKIFAIFTNLRKLPALNGFAFHVSSFFSSVKSLCFLFIFTFGCFYQVKYIFKFWWFLFCIDANESVFLQVSF